MSFLFKKKKDKSSTDSKDKKKDTKKKDSKKKDKKSMSKLSIDSLPNLLLANILTIVSDEHHDNVSAYRLVCKLWSDVIVKQVPVRINFNKKTSDSKQLLGFYHVHRTIVKFSKISYLSFRANKSLDVDLLLDLFNGSQKRFCESLVHLDIGKMELQTRDPKMQLINTVLKNFPNLAVLDISENEINTASLRLFADSLSNNSSLQCLNISINPIGDEEGCKLLGSKIFKESRNSIRFLNVRACGINGVSIEQNHNNFNALESLFFDDSTSSLYPKVHKIHSLLVGHNPLGVSGAATLEKLLLKNDSLGYLDMEYCSLSTDGFLMLSKALLQNISLEFLDLSNNQINYTDEVRLFEENFEKHRQSKLVHLETSMNKWQYEKRKHNSESFLFPLLCLKNYDLRYTLVDCLSSIENKGYYCPLKFRQLSVISDKPLYSQRKCE
ncbi:hypothetical protein DICPUDRAFT_86229 [Dictyostelium purpureum]|uniref:F-box domain-containing protein n=1 Tax=Dictyostelium purpureum TaxID=5786 RepID=F0ZAC5_DICPU|nr:uncharacterized protein DICPUDRAFT_86229 [Dictyostelium purpureum]EGC39099.1 hypothetical protein DICPUDRAFT_86229 [Dictyostelium purpureum]|eukprot:XP_003284351.1 hypothetical protein DICPUDRAFT_86229 [Dictyostelium purpureum]